MTPLFLSSGLFLGWSLGANDTANIFGTAVATRMVRFSVAATIASVFVILGGVLGGAGAAETLGVLGSVNALAGAFTVAFSAAVIITWMTRLGLPVSTSQAIVGAIIGWNIFTGSPTDTNILSVIVSSWVFSVLLAAFFSLVIFKISKFFLDRAKVHILRIDHYNRILLIAVGAFGAYSLGANNIGNVMGVFIPVQFFSDSTYFGFLTITGTQKLFFLGGLAISAGVFTYAHRVISTVGSEIYKLTPITALIVVFSHSLVLFLFSSQWVEYQLISLGLPSIPLVPVSSSQVIVGGIIGISLAKVGGRGINLRVLGKIALGWVATPAIALVFSLVSLFIVQNVFEHNVAQQERYELNPAVLARMQVAQLPAGHLEGLSGQRYHGSEDFRQQLLAVHPWKERELFQIFLYAKIDLIQITNERLQSLAAARHFSPSEQEALKKLSGRVFTHRWQFEEALAQASPLWALKEDTKKNKPWNEQLLKKREKAFAIFARTFWE